MQIETTGEQGVFTVAVAGRVDSGTVGELHAVLDGVIAEGGTNLVLDFAGVEFMSSASLRMLVDVLKNVRTHGGDLRLAGLQTPVAKIFDLTGLAGILRMFPDAASAAASFGEA